MSLFLKLLKPLLWKLYRWPWVKVYQLMVWTHSHLWSLYRVAFWQYIIHGKFFSFSQNLKFFKISQWNSIFSCKFKLFPLFMNEEKWKKCWVVYVCYRIILERCESKAHMGSSIHYVSKRTWWVGLENDLLCWHSGLYLSWPSV